MLEGKGSFVHKIRGTRICARRKMEFCTQNMTEGDFCAKNENTDFWNIVPTLIKWPNIAFEKTRNRAGSPNG